MEDSLVLGYLSVGFLWAFFSSWSVDRTALHTLFWFVVAILFWPAEIVLAAIGGLFHVLRDLVDKED